MFYQWNDQQLILNCRIQTKAGIDRFAEVVDDYLKIRITAAPVDGKANRHLIKFLSRQLKTSQSQIEIIQGLNSRDKRIGITSPGHVPPELKIKAKDHA